jgi:hypothetical protein
MSGGGRVGWRGGQGRCVRGDNTAMIIITIIKNNIITKN